jgi:hypothetical protein
VLSGAPLAGPRPARLSPVLAPRLPDEFGQRLDLFLLPLQAGAQLLQLGLRCGQMRLLFLDGIDENDAPSRQQARTKRRRTPAAR